MEIKNAVIESAWITSQDHGCLSAWVKLRYSPASVQCFGGFALYLSKLHTHHELKSVAGHYIWRVMEIAGVTDWSNLPGKCVRARIDDRDLIEAIGHIINDDWFCPESDFKDSTTPAEKPAQDEKVDDEPKYWALLHIERQKSAELKKWLDEQIEDCKKHLDRSPDWMKPSIQTYRLEAFCQVQAVISKIAIGDWHASSFIDLKKRPIPKWVGMSDDLTDPSKSQGA